MPTPTTDFSIFDWQELVTYAPASGSVVEDVRALRRPLTRSAMRNVERFVELEPTDVVFYLEGTNLASILLGLNDSITDSLSVVYEVVFYERQTLNSVVAVVCRPT